VKKERVEALCNEIISPKIFFLMDDFLFLSCEYKFLTQTTKLRIPEGASPRKRASPEERASPEARTSPKKLAQSQQGSGLI
jgi:hypothetical protein